MSKKSFTWRESAMRPTEKAVLEPLGKKPYSSQTNIHNKHTAIFRFVCLEKSYRDEPLSGKYRCTLPDGWKIICIRELFSYTKTYRWVAYFVPPNNAEKFRSDKRYGKKAISGYDQKFPVDCIAHLLAIPVFWNQEMYRWQSYQHLCRPWIAIEGQDGKTPPMKNIGEIPSQAWLNRKAKR